MKAVILAGGLGSRLRPFDEVIPKPLLPSSSEYYNMNALIENLLQTNEPVDAEALATG